MRTLTKNIAAFGLMLTTISAARGMEFPNKKAICWCINKGSFQVCGPYSSEWGPEIPGHLIAMNRDRSAALVERNGKYFAIHIESGQVALWPFPNTFAPYFSTKHTLVYARDPESLQMFIVNTQNDANFVTPEGTTNVWFSPDENFAVVDKETDGRVLKVAFNTITGALIGPVPEKAFCPRYSSDGTLIAIQLLTEPQFYSAATGALIRTIPAVFDGFFGPDLARFDMGTSYVFYRISDGIEVDENGTEIAK